jgi:hypothetical protein
MTTKPGFVTIPNTTYDASDWEITSQVTLTSGVIWKGGKFTMPSGAAFTSKGNCIGAQISNVELASSVEWLIDAGMKPFLTYDGTDGTFLYKDLLIDGVKISGRTMIYNGPWEAMKTYHNVSFGITVNNVIRTYDNTTSSNTLVFGNSIYKFRANNWQLIGDSKTPDADNGVIYIIGGNGQIKNFYRRGKQYGYIMRCFGGKLGSDQDQDTKVINCVDSETVCYGTLDFNLNPNNLSSNAIIPITGISAFFINNTSANKEDMNNGYVTSALVLGQTVDDLGIIWPVTLQNSVAFGAHVSAMSNNSSLFKNNSSGKTKLIQSGNIDIPPGEACPDGVVDQNYYGLTAAGAQNPNPIPPKKRTVVSAVFTYDDGTTSIL